MDNARTDFDRIHGPRNARERLDLRTKIELAANLRITDADWDLLTHWTSRANFHFCFRSPPTAESRKKLEAVVAAAKAFRDAATAILPEMRSETFNLGRVPASIALSSEINTQLDEIDELQYDPIDASDFVLYARNSAVIIADAGNIALNDTLPSAPGKKIAGYDTFLKICRVVWARHRTGPGFKRSGGRVKGEFVEFVFACQCLLALDMQRGSAAAVGDAIAAWTIRGEPGGE